MKNNGGNLIVNRNFRCETREMIRLLLQAFEEEATDFAKKYARLEQSCVASERNAGFWKALCQHMDREMGRYQEQASIAGQDADMWKYQAMELTARLLESTLQCSTGAATRGEKKDDVV